MPEENVIPTPIEDRKPHGPGFPCPCNDGGLCLEVKCTCDGVCHGHMSCNHSPLCNCGGCNCRNCNDAYQRFRGILRERESSTNYKFVAECFVDLFLQPMGIESWSPDRMEEVTKGFERIGHSETAEHLRKGYAFCLEKRVPQ